MTLHDCFVYLGTLEPQARELLRECLALPSVKQDQREMETAASAVEEVIVLAGRADLPVLLDTVDLLWTYEDDLNARIEEQHQVWSDGSLHMLRGQARGIELVQEEIDRIAVKHFQNGEDSLAVYLRDSLQEKVGDIKDAIASQMEKENQRQSQYKEGQQWSEGEGGAQDT